MYLGITKYIDYPKKFWKSKAWELSIISVSRDLIYNIYKDIILLKDIIRFI